LSRCSTYVAIARGSGTRPEAEPATESLPGSGPLN